MKSLLLILFLFLPCLVEAQPRQHKLDSLHSALHNAANDTIRMDVQTQLGFHYFNENIDSSDFYLKQGLAIAQDLKLKLYEAGILSSQAYRLAWDNYPKALELSLRALKISEDVASERNVWNLPAGHTPHDERIGILGWTYFNIAQLYGNTGNTEKQISSLIQAMNIAQSVGDSTLNMVANLNIGTIYLDKLKKLDSALYFEQRALMLFSKITGDRNSIGWVYGSIGAIYLEKENFNLAGDAFERGLQLMQQQNNLAGIGSLCLSLSNLYKTINKPDSSLLFAYKALETYKTFNDQKGIANAYVALSSTYYKQRSTDSAFAYLKLATALHDSLNNIERKNLLAYQNANFDEQMRVKKLEDEKIQTRTKIRTYAMLAGIGVFMAIAFLLYRNNLHRKKANVLLQKQKEEIAEQKESIEKTLVELKSTQAQLIQSEKMASLGELTAGIAHEIQNPLNFVNNFSEINTELIDELLREAAKENIEEVTAIAKDIKENEEKINHHGKRADAIVKGMLQHSRSSSGVKEPTNINALADEYLRLAYHGLRAKDKSFNAILKTDFDETISFINIIPQDIGRVILNLITNAFYAVDEKKKSGIEQYDPTVSVRTKEINDRVQIIVADNGSGIPTPIVDKIFHPFFTTKPTGSGTGLGLSLAYDIIKAHGGELKVDTKENGGSAFTITLPNQ